MPHQIVQSIVVQGATNEGIEAIKDKDRKSQKNRKGRGLGGGEKGKKQGRT